MPIGSKLSPVTVFFFFFIIIIIAHNVQSSSSQKFDPLLLPSDLERDDDSHVCPRPTAEEAADSCPVKCFRTDPVCGVDGVTYWCGCADAHCSGTRVAKLGFCEVENGGSGQALLLVHIVWLILLGIFVLFGLL